MCCNIKIVLENSFPLTLRNSVKNGVASAAVKLPVNILSGKDGTSGKNAMQPFYRLQEVWLPFIISIEKRYEFTFRLGNAPVTGRRHPFVFLVDNPDASILQITHNFFPAVCRSIIYHNQFKIRNTLMENRPNGSEDIMHAVV